MGGLPENLDKNRLMSMQMAPSLLELPLKERGYQLQAKQLGLLGKHYDTESRKLDLYGQASRDSIINEFQKMLGDPEFQAFVQERGIGRKPLVGPNNQPIPGKYEQTAGWGPGWAFGGGKKDAIDLPTLFSEFIALRGNGASGLTSPILGGLTPAQDPQVQAWQQ